MMQPTQRTIRKVGKITQAILTSAKNDKEAVSQNLGGIKLGGGRGKLGDGISASDGL